MGDKTPLVKIGGGGEACVCLLPLFKNENLFVHSVNSLQFSPYIIFLILFTTAKIYIKRHLRTQYYFFKDGKEHPPLIPFPGDDGLKYSLPTRGNIFTPVIY